MTSLSCGLSECGTSSSNPAFVKRRRIPEMNPS
jgi:hypothetical protein